MLPGFEHFGDCLDRGQAVFLRRECFETVAPGDRECEAAEVDQVEEPLPLSDHQSPETARGRQQAQEDQGHQEEEEEGQEAHQGREDTATKIEETGQEIEGQEMIHQLIQFN